MKYKSILLSSVCICFVFLVVITQIIHIEHHHPATVLTGITSIEESAIKEKPLIIIDPGHGGVDGGACANGLIEKDINLAISLNLRDLLSTQGFRVIMTREEDCSLHDEGITSISRQKRSDLHHRLALTEAHPDAVFISIHQNKFEQPSSHGAQIFYTTNFPEAELLAKSIQDHFISELQPENHRQIKPADNNLFLLYEAKVPAIMAECGFLSNPEEASKLATEDYQKKIAFVIYQGILDYFTTENR